jgi:site-specific recombinase
MTDNQEKAFKRFGSKAMLDNIEQIKDMIQRIRQQEGGIGSVKDELALHRTIQDLDLLIDLVDGIKAAYDSLIKEHQDLTGAALQIQSQKDGLKESYERMILERNERIKELEGQLAKKKSKARKKPKA